MDVDFYVVIDFGSSAVGATRHEDGIECAVAHTANFFCWPAIVINSYRDIYDFKSISYCCFSIAGDSPRRS